MANTEVQQLKDKKDKIKSRLFCKLIMSLNEKVPEKKQGHYASLAHLHICLNCSKIITRESASYVPCHVQYISVKYNCDIIFSHSRDPKWSINEYIKSIWAECKSWSNIYWRLWSQCHFLYCCMCCAMYAAAFTDFCPYHPQQPHFYPLEHYQTANFPTGRYPCCGSKAIKYETASMPSGCRLRSHIPKLQTSDDTHIQKIIDLFPDLIKLKHTEDNVTSLTENYNFANFEKISKSTFISTEEWRVYQGLLNGPLFETCVEITKKSTTSDVWERSNELTITNLREEFGNDDNCSIGESENSETSFIYDIAMFNSKPNELVSTNTVVQTKSDSNEIKSVWSSNYSVRYNQDNQREYEEITFQTFPEILMQKSSSGKKLEKKNEAKKINSFFGGTYTEIELERREILKLKLALNKQKSS